MNLVYILFINSQPPRRDRFFLYVLWQVVLNQTSKLDYIKATTGNAHGHAQKGTERKLGDSEHYKHIIALYTREKDTLSNIIIIFTFVKHKNVFNTANSKLCIERVKPHPQCWSFRWFHNQPELVDIAERK
jgi:hypothetical protein